MIPDELIEQVRDSTDLVALIGESVELKRTGSDYRGPCPFHGGQHRNFAVIPRKGRFYCFVCKAAGDVFTWYMKRAGMDYPTAVREAARRAGIVIPEGPAREGPDPREPLFQAVSVAHDWFVRQLREAPEAEDGRSYLGSRGLDLDSVGPFELGYAPRTRVFEEAMAQLGLKPELLLEAGLLARREDGTVVPRFRGRLLFPIHDLRGRVVGFGGRLLGPGEPKYLNSPETPIYHKGATLYNLHAARNAIRKEGMVILVEGYFDVLRLLLAGIEHVVAPLGTALTTDQAALLKRYSQQAVLLLDSDMAGLKATFRAGDELLRHEIRVRVGTLPPGEDPDSLVRRGGAEALEPILRDAVDIMERKIQLLDRKGWFRDIEHRREALDRLLPTIRAARDPIQRELYLSLVAERCGIDKKVLDQEATQRPVPEPRPAALTVTRRAAAPPPQPKNDGGRAELALLRLLVASGEWRERAAEGIPPEWFESGLHRDLFEALRRQGGEGVAAIPEGTPPALAAFWGGLMAAPPTASDDLLYEDACRVLESRPHFRHLDELNGRLDRTEGDEQNALMREQLALNADLRKRFPEEFERRYGWRRLRRRANQRRQQ